MAYHVISTNLRSSFWVLHPIITYTQMWYSQFFFHGLQSTKIVSGLHRAEGGPSQQVKQVVPRGVQVVGVGLA